MATAYSFNTQKVLTICQKNDISMVGVFGSEARGQAKKDSDIDLLVRFSFPKSLLSIVKLERELTELLGKKVDLLTEESLSPYLKEDIMSELKVLYEEQ